MTNPGMMPRRIVVDTLLLATAERPCSSGWCEYGYCECGCVMDPIRVVGKRRPTVTEAAAERRHEKWLAERAGRDGTAPSFTREKSYLAARRAAGLR